jgi:hypothetical protein
MTSANWPVKGGGSASWKDAVPNAGSLPTGATDCEARMACDTKVIWAWDQGSVMWVQVTAPVGATLTPTRAVVTNGTGQLITSAVTSTEVGFLTGLTSNVQTHITDATIHFTVGSISHTAIQDIGTNTHAQIDTHIADATIHFTEASIDHTAIQNIGTNSHAAIDTHIGDATIHFTVGSISHTAIQDIGTNTHAQIDSHIADATIHFTEASIDHTAITNIGTNSHAAIDTHIADATIHFTEASIDHTAIQNIGTNTHAQIDTFISGAQATAGQVSVAGNVTLTNKRIHNVNTTAARTLTLPAAATSVYLSIKDITGDAQSNVITVNTPGAETIDGAASLVLDSDYIAVTIYSDGSNYFVL